MAILIPTTQILKIIFKGPHFKKFNLIKKHKNEHVVLKNKIIVLKKVI